MRKDELDIFQAVNVLLENSIYNENIDPKSYMMYYDYLNGFINTFKKYYPTLEKEINYKKFKESISSAERALTIKTLEKSLKKS